MSSGSVSKGSKRSILSIRDRLHQIHRWLIHVYERESRLRVEKLPEESKDCLGYVEIGQGKPLIRVSKSISRSESVSVLIHEYCHVISHYEHGPHWRRECDGHDRKFYSVLCEVENRFFYEDGSVDSEDF